MRKKIVAIVQARMGSTRLPGKVMKEINKNPLIYYLLEQLKHSKLIDEIVLATSRMPENDSLSNFVESMGVNVFRGPEDDVLKRFVQASNEYNADIIIRITADEPLIDPFIVDDVIKDHIEKKAEYTSTKLIKTIPKGLDLEIFPKEVLLRIDKLSKTGYEREHITPYIYNHPKEFRINAYRSKEKFDTEPILTVDSADDFEFIRSIIENLYEEGRAITINQILDFINENNST